MDNHEPRFLYVEDDKMSREVFEVLIKDVLGYSHLIVFENSANFLEKLSALPTSPNVFFLDVQIDPHDGYEMLKMLRSNPIYQKATVIAMTANVMSYDIEQLQQAGFDGLIGKPIVQRVFPQLVERLLTGESVWYVP
ncbi:MAG: response regulator [Anaerolineae bacterium]|nr:response regulator [Anaerolineae bacterium]